MLRLVCVAAVIVAAIAVPITDVGLDDEWKIFQTMYRKEYNLVGEAMMRRQIWESNVRLIQKHNLEFDRGLHTYSLGMNEYGDMTSQEFIQTMNGYIMRNTTSGGSLFLPPSNVKVPDTVDWRPKGYVTPVKNQGQCGSCWAFSTTGSLEGQTFKKTGKLVSLSEQNLVDCSSREGNHGCKGGLMDQGFKYIKINNGIDTESSYPYTARTGFFCKFKRNDVGATDTGFVDVTSKSESDLQSAVATIGPISVAMDAGHSSFQLYKTGIYSEPKCSSTRLDHGVLAVGYGTEDGKDYWLVKNSWGTKWGMEGYFKIARNSGNMCGLATQASYPTV